MKNIYFIQANISCTEVRSYLPYAVGCLISFSWQKEEIVSSYNAADIFFMREKPEQIVKFLDSPYLLAFSCSTWNLEYNRAVAREIKKAFPECLIMFGGHSITARKELTDEYPEADYFIFGEGEEPFYQLLLALDGKMPLDEVDNLIYRRNGKAVITTEKYDFDIENYPSPYCTGVFDKLIEQHPEIEFNITMETNRGCPYGCTYCDWSCSKKVRLFSMERIKSEINWMAEHKISYCMPGDANFGISDRDVEIARYLVEVRNKTGYPQIFKPCYAKFNEENVFAAGVLLNSCGADKGVTVSCQSMSDTVLENIDRRNISAEQFRRLIRRFAEKNIATYTELIVGLPGETLESFCRGICETIEYGQNNSMSVYMCYLFPGSPMSDPEYRKKHGIRTVRMPINTAHYSPDFNGIPEYYDVVVETNTMPFDHWVKSNVFAFTVQCFHHMGMLRCIAAYLRREKNISYYSFYSSLYDFLLENPDTVAGKYISGVYEQLSDTSGNWTYRDSRFSDVGWFFEEGMFLHTAYSLETFFEEIKPFISRFGIESEMLDDLITYQKSIIRLPGATQKTVVSPYNFTEYFAGSDGNCTPLKKIRETVNVRFTKNIPDWKTYAIEIVWYGKRRSETLITNSREHTEYMYE